MPLNSSGHGSVIPQSTLGEVGGSATSSSASWPVRSPWVVLVFVIWILWAAILFGGAILGPLNANGTTHIPTWARMSSSALLVLAAWMFVAGVVAPARKAAVLIAVGMTLGFIGDLFNAELMPVLKDNPVLGGIGSFGLGHIAYILAGIDVARRASLPNSRKRWLAILAWQLVGCVGWYIAVYTGDKARGLIVPALVYSLLLAGTTGLFTSLALENRRLTGLAIGAALFLLSDLILAFRLFHGDFRLGGDAVWLTYGPGQMLIVYSLASVSRVLMGATSHPSSASGRVGAVT